MKLLEGQYVRHVYNGNARGRDDLDTADRAGLSIIGQDQSSKRRVALRGELTISSTLICSMESSRCISDSTFISMPVKKYLLSMIIQDCL